MRLTAKGRYAVSAMLDLALHDGEGPISLADISERRDISPSYLEQLFSKLRRNACQQRPGGGYTLSRVAEQIFVAEIIDSVDESVDATRCHGRADCQHGAKCLTHELWSDLSEQIHQFLAGIDLASVLARRGVLTPSEEAANEAADSEAALIRLPAREIAQ